MNGSIHRIEVWQAYRSARISQKAFNYYRLLVRMWEHVAPLLAILGCWNYEKLRLFEERKFREYAFKTWRYAETSRALVGIQYLDSNEKTMQQSYCSRLQKLRRSWNQGMRKMAGVVRQFYFGHGQTTQSKLQLGSLPGQRRKLRTRKLSMGYVYSTSAKQAQIQTRDIQWRNTFNSRMVSQNWHPFLDNSQANTNFRVADRKRSNRTGPEKSHTTSLMFAGAQ